VEIKASLISFSKGFSQAKGLPNLHGMGKCSNFERLKIDMRLS